MFDQFDSRFVTVGDVRIHCRIGGAGPAVLLLHGYPQNHAMWAGVAERLASRFTVVCADLRGYGESSKPADADDHSTYSFRAMAADQVGLMEALGHARFGVAGHDRGARVTHRMALDRPDRVQAMAVLDIAPTLYMYEHTDRRFASTYWLWFFLPLPAPMPEKLIGADPDFFFESALGRYGGTSLDGFDREQLESYRRSWRDPAMIAASCADYRAGASIDLEHDRADLDRRVDCPSLAMWAGDGLMAQHFDFERIWAQRCTQLQTASVSGGHFFPDHNPADTARVLGDFFSRTLAR